MSSKYKITDKEGIYFVSCTVGAWTDIFTRDQYRDTLLDCIRYPHSHKGLILHAWVLMTNHIHLICSCKPPHDLAIIIRNIKAITAMKIVNAIINSKTERRREIMFNTFQQEGKKSSSNFHFKFWEHENQPILLNSTFIYNQRLNYLHWNPVRAGFVTDPSNWKHSSAMDYFTTEKGLLDLTII